MRLHVLPFLFCSLAPLLFASSLIDSAGATTSAGPRPATPEERKILHDALHESAADLHRWAYTENRVVRDEKGRVKSEQRVRFDPSKPYAEQWTPLSIDGREPTERDRERFRRRGENSDPSQPAKRRSWRRPALGELIDLERASISGESGTHWTFEIPLLQVGNQRFPPEKFQVHTRVRKDGALLEMIAVSLRDSFRSKFIVKVKSGEGVIEFDRIDPAHPPTMVAVNGDASASVLFVSVGGSVDLRRTDLKRVKPYDERFEVQIGTLKAIDF